MKPEWHGQHIAPLWLDERDGDNLRDMIRQFPLTKEDVLEIIKSNGLARDDLADMARQLPGTKEFFIFFNVPSKKDVVPPAACSAWIPCGGNVKTGEKFASPCMGALNGEEVLRLSGRESPEPVPVQADSESYVPFPPVTRRA